MIILAIGFSTVCALLSLDFHRKYKARLGVDNLTMRYSRIGDYYGHPISLAFHYKTEDHGTPVPVSVDVDEIYHYGSDYFLRGFNGSDKRCQIYKWSRIESPRIRDNGRSLASLDDLFSECHFTASMDKS